LHDIGRLNIPKEWTDRKTALTPEERDLVNQHAGQGSLWLLRREDLPPQLGLLAAWHHVDFSGDDVKTTYKPDIFHKVLAMADDYDLSVNSDKYYWRKHRKDRTLRKMLNKRGVCYDSTLIKLLINCVGYFPVGSLVQLDTGERGIVVLPNLYHAGRPKVYLFESAENETTGAQVAAETIPGSDQAGTVEGTEAPPKILDLTEINDTGMDFKHTITALLSPPSDINIQSILDKKKEYLLSFTI